VAQDDSKDDEGYDTPTAPSFGMINSNADIGTSTQSPSVIYTRRTISSGSTTSLKTPVWYPPKSTDQLEKEYLENIAALTHRDEEDWLKAVILLEIDRSVDALYQEEQRTIAIIDEYYASMREDQARRKAIRATERIEEHKRTAVFAD
jgi:hypothetical protein